MKVFYALISLIFIYFSLNASELPECGSESFRDNCFGTYTWDDNSFYKGEWKKNTHLWRVH